ncbi:hypothetical protein GDO81_001111 [Engystomops pustulosus]|uniref:Uncharacterized protein n=1 Tax=Engystomops pustulosus TaxID=76066 RepID=A0AAV7D9N4_ENGPU|nr:hypothetical protein GDO81_001111 [Engystomops pustulosus]
MYCKTYVANNTENSKEKEGDRRERSCMGEGLMDISKACDIRDSRSHYRTGALNSVLTVYCRIWIDQDYVWGSTGTMLMHNGPLRGQG